MPCHKAIYAILATKFREIRLNSEKILGESRHLRRGKQIGRTLNPDISGNPAAIRKAGNPQEIPSLNDEQASGETISVCSPGHRKYEVAFYDLGFGPPCLLDRRRCEGVDRSHDTVRGVVDGPDRRGAEEVRPGAYILEAFLEVGRCLLGQEGLHDDGRGDGVGEGLEEAEPEAREEFLLAAQEDAHAGLRVVLEV